MSKIQWTDRTWNPIRGCSKVSAGCANCYAERVAARFSASGPEQSPVRSGPFHGVIDRGRWSGRIELVPDKLLDPVQWRKPQRIFVNSMSDLFHAQVTDRYIDRVVAVMAITPRHTYQALTKRADRMEAYMAAQDRVERVRAASAEDFYENTPGDCDIAEWPPRNVWFGVSCENQATAEERIPALLRTPAAVRFVSLEPLLGPIDLTKWDALESGLNWVIVGGESGPRARPCHIDWIRSIRDQCAAAGVPVFVKQLGTNALGASVTGVTRDIRRLKIKHPKGGDPAEWPEDLRVRQFPTN